jgi:O-antigen/teichoic acid export membrane protein
LIYIVIATRVLGPERFGVLVLVHSFAMTIGGVIAFPGWHGLVRYGVEALDARDHDRLARLLRLLGSLELLGGVVAVVVAAMVAPILGPRLGWSSEAQSWALPYSLAVLASVRATPGGFLQIIRRFDLIGAHNLVTPIIRLIGSILVAQFGWGLNGFLAVWLLAALAEGGALWIIGHVLARRHIGQTSRWDGYQAIKTENPGLPRFALFANADLLLSGLTGWVAPLVMGWLLGPAAAGLYAIANRTTNVFVQPAQLLGQAAYSELVRLVSAGYSGHDIRLALVKCIAVAMAAALPVAAIIALFSQQAVTLIAGPAFVGAAPVLIWLSVARAIGLACPSASMALTALGKPGLSLLTNFVTGAVILLALPYMVFQWGLNGAGAHAFIQSLSAVLLLSLFVYRATRMDVPKVRN